jgi:hypothetical protein
MRQEQGAGEASISIEGHDQHEAAAWPDMKGVLLQPSRAVSSRRDRQLLVAMRQMLIANLVVILLSHRVADHRARAIHGDDCVKALVPNRPILFISQQQAAACEIQACAACLKGEFSPRRFRRIEQQIF